MVLSRLSLRCFPTSELDTGPKRDITVIGCPIESGNDVGAAFGVSDVPMRAFVARGFEHQEGFVWKT